MDGKIIKLADPVTVYETKYSQIVLREPRGDVFNRLGPPRVPVYNQSAGSGYFVEQNDTIAAYLKANRKWWLLPIFASLLAMGAILALSGTAAAPFIYTLF